MQPQRYRKKFEWQSLSHNFFHNFANYLFEIHISNNSFNSNAL